jgi:fatty acid-binding protein DegV
VDKVRGGKAAHPRVVELLRERVDPARPVLVSVGHAAAPIWADRLRILLQQSFIIGELFACEIGPVVGAHVGPGCVGAVMFQPTDEELPLIAPLA